MRNLKRVLCAALAGVLAFSMVGCGKGKDGNGNSSSGAPGKTSEAKNESSDHVFAEDASFSVDGLTGNISTYVLTDDSIYVAAYEWSEGSSETDATETDTEETEVEEASKDEVSEADDEVADMNNGVYTNRIYSVPIDGGSAEVIYENNEDGNIFVNNLFVKPDGTLCCVFEDYGKEGDKTKYILKERNGNEFKEVMDLGSLTDDPNTYLTKLFYDDKGNLIVFFDTEVIVLDQNNNKIASAKPDNGYFDAVGIDKEGNILLVSTTYDDKAEKYNTLVKKFDIAQNKITDEYPIDVSYLQSNDGITKGVGDYDFFYKTNVAIYGFKYADKSATKVVDFSSSDISSDMTYNIQMVGLDTFLAICWDDTNYEKQSVEKFVKVDPSQVENREILTLASVYGNYTIKQAITEYNKSQTKFKIKFVDYSEESDPASKISADIAAGDIPDMLDVSYGVGNMSLDQCIAKGLLEDLTPYIDKDEEISKEDFIPSVYEAMQHDGKIYAVSSSASLMTLLARKSEVGEEDGWTFQEMKEYVDSQPESAKLFYSDNKSDMLECFMYGCGKDFVNWDKGECYFDTQDFKDVLEMSNRGTNDEMNYDEERPSTTEMVRNHEMLFVDGGIAVDSLVMYKAMFEDDVVCKGYPNKDKKGNFFVFEDSIAISSKCSDKEAAWQFVRQFMTEDYQSKHYLSTYGIPTREDVYEAFVQCYTCTEETKDKYGNDIYPNEGSYGMEGLEVECKPLTQEQVDEYRKVLDSAGGVWESDDNIRKIVLEEAAAYFNGDKSIDDVCAVIQNRATTYVNENK